MNVPTPPAPAAPSKPVAWIGPADLLISLVVVILAAFCASFVSRISDQWLYFAAGRDLLSGKYSFGSDPYSYLAVDRTWVNHSWLFDVFASLLYKADPSGEVVVAAKAGVFALAVAIAMLVRPRGAPVWPWWLLAALAVVAAAPYAHLRPTIMSALCVAIVLVILLRLSWKAGSWRNPILLAVLCGLWANLDQWFLIGPAMVALTLVAEVLQKKLSKDAASNAPAVKDLVRALGLCLVATLVNPHHIRVWELPVELGAGLPDSVGLDPQLNLLRLSPLAPAYRDSTNYGKSANGGAFAALFIIGSGLLALGLARVRLALMLLWVLFAFLALMNYRLILLFAIAAISLAATPLSDLATRFTAEPQSRGVQLASSLSRILALPLSLLLLACAWPGWLHPAPGDRSLVNRVALGVEPDPGFARAAKRLESERASLEGLNGAPLSVEFANHIAWFAPHEKVAINGRFRHHAQDLDTWLTARRAVLGEKPGDLAEAMAALKADYAILNTNGSGREVDLPHAIAQTQSGKLALWHLDGRVAVLGRADKPFRFDAKALAFALNQTPLPEPVVMPPPARATREALDDFVIFEKQLPLESLDASVYFDYTRYLWQQAILDHQRTVLANFALGGAAARLLDYPPNVPDEVIAGNLLAQRAARQAMASNPDQPTAYWILAECLANNSNWMPAFQSDDFELQRITLLRRFLDRMPPAAELPVNDNSTPVLAALESLANYYRQQNVQMEDSYIETVLRFFETQKRLLPTKQPAMTPEQMKTVTEQMDKQRTNLMEGLQRLREESSLQTTPLAKAQLAITKRRPEEMLKLLQSGALAKDTSREAIEAEIRGIDLCLNAGLLEGVLPLDGSDLSKTRLDALKEKMEKAGMELTMHAALLAKARRIAGNLPAIRETLVATRNQIPPLPLPLEELVKASIKSPQDYSLRFHGTLDGALGGIPALAISQMVSQPTLKVWRDVANIEIRLGVIALLEGQPKEARACFEAALKPLGIPLPAFFAETAIAEKYLRLVKDNTK